MALTFDDGPRTSTTSRLLDGLALREIQATFFLVGDRIQGQEVLVRRMAEDGHQIGVHSYDHSCISDLSRGTSTSRWAEPGRPLRRAGLR